MASVWDTLGIAETDDVGAVRSAYARALKRIDMDADPRAYIALREARDHAIRMIRYAVWESADEEPEAPAAVATAPEAPPAPIDIARTAYEDHLAELTRLLLPGQGEAEQPDAGLVRAHFDALLTDSRMEEIAFRAQAEAQLAHLIAAALPRSSMLLRPAMTAFGWVGPSRIDTQPSIAAILDAAQGLDALDDIPVQPVPSPMVETPPPADDGSDAQARFFSEQYNALAGLLFPQAEDPAPLTPEEQRTASGLFATLLCDPRMELVTFRVGAEAQFAQMIAYSIPRSDCVLPRAVAFFHWEETQGRIDQADAIAHILNRERGLRFMHAVQSPDHPFHAAWNELRAPVNPNRPAVGSIHSGTIYTLLTSIRTEQPLLERELDGARVALWDERLTRYRPNGQGGGYVAAKNRFPPWLIVLILFVGLGVLGQIAQSLNPPANRSGTALPSGLLGDGGSGTLSDVDADLDIALARFGSSPKVTAADIQAKNPKLYTALQKRWVDAHDEDVSRSTFSDQTYRFLSGQLSQLLNRAPRDELAIYWRIEIGRLETQRRVMPSDCANYIAGNVRPFPLIGKQVDDMNALSARLLTDAPYDDQPPSGPRRYVIPGSIVTRAAKLAGMPADQFTAALHGKGIAGAPCTARIGLIKAVLDTPGKDGDRLMREM